MLLFVEGRGLAEEQRTSKKLENRVAGIQARVRSRAGPPSQEWREGAGQDQPEDTKGKGEQETRASRVKGVGVDRLGGVYLAIEGSDKPRRQCELSIVGATESGGLSSWPPPANEERRRERRRGRTKRTSRRYTERQRREGPGKK